jgi:hypothetical protein
MFLFVCVSISVSMMALGVKIQECYDAMSFIHEERSYEYGEVMLPHLWAATGSWLSRA